MTATTHTITVTRKYICAPYSALTGKARDNAYDNITRSIVDDDWWRIELEDCAELVEEDFGVRIDTQKTYVGVYPSYASWTIDDITNINTLLDKLGVTNAAHRAFLSDYHSVGNGTVNFYAYTRWTYSTAHQHSSVEAWPIDSDDSEETHGLSVPEQELLFDTVGHAWDSLVAEIARFIARYFESQYDYVHTDEYIADFCDANEYIFDAVTGESFFISEAEEA